MGLAAAFLSVPAAAWAATPDVPEPLRIPNGPYEGFQVWGAQTPPAFSTTNSSAPLFAASVKGVVPQPNLVGTMELARPGEQPFRTFQASAGPVGYVGNPDSHQHIQPG